MRWNFASCNSNTGKSAVMCERSHGEKKRYCQYDTKPISVLKSCNSYERVNEPALRKAKDNTLIFPNFDAGQANAVLQQLVDSDRSVWPKVKCTDFTVSDTPPPLKHCNKDSDPRALCGMPILANLRIAASPNQVSYKSKVCRQTTRNMGRFL